MLDRPDHAQAANVGGCQQMQTISRLSNLNCGRKVYVPALNDIPVFRVGASEAVQFFKDHGWFVPW